MVLKTMDSKKEVLHYKSDWQEFYKQRMVSAEEAVRVIKSGDFVVAPRYHRKSPRGPHLFL